MEGDSPMSAEKIIEHLMQMGHEDMDLILIEGEPFCHAG